MGAVAKGAATGAAGGAVAGPEGAAAGAAAGAAGAEKAKHAAKKAARANGTGGAESASNTSQSGPPAGKRSTPPAQDHYQNAKKAKKEISSHLPKPTGGRGSSPRRMLVAEFVVCTIILALSPLSAKHKDDDVVKWMSRAGAISLLFLMLGLIATISDKAGRVAAAMGLTIMVGLLVSDADVFQNFLAGLQVPQRKPDGISPGTGDFNVPVPTPSGAIGGVGGGEPSPTNWGSAILGGG